jgi:hypothetical protein
METEDVIERFRDKASSRIVWRIPCGTQIEKKPMPTLNRWVEAAVQTNLKSGQNDVS